MLFEAVVDALEGIVPSQEVVDELPDVFRDDAPCNAGLFRAGSEGFLNSPLTFALGLVGRAVIVLEPDFGGNIVLAGLGLLRLDNGGLAGDSFGVEARPALGVCILDFGVLTGGMLDVLFWGLSSMVVRGGL